MSNPSEWTFTSDRSYVNAETGELELDPRINRTLPQDPAIGAVAMIMDRQRVKDYVDRNFITLPEPFTDEALHQLVRHFCETRLHEMRRQDTLPYLPTLAVARRVLVGMWNEAEVNMRQGGEKKSGGF